MTQTRATCNLQATTMFCRSYSCDFQPHCSSLQQPTNLIFILNFWPCGSNWSSTLIISAICLYKWESAVTMILTPQLKTYRGAKCVKKKREGTGGHKHRKNKLTFVYKTIKIQNVKKAWLKVWFVFCIMSYLKSSK